VVGKFVGQYEHTLDTKGRVILPVKFREPFERGGFITTNREGCLALWTPAEYERQSGIIQEEANTDRAHRNRARYWAANTAEVDVDRQGRMAIPPQLRSFAKLQTEVLVNGVIDRIELWDPQVWNERVVPEESWFLEGDED
jgi:MraZ protein